MRKQKTKKSWCPCVFLSSWAFFVLTLTCLILSHPAQAAEYYVSVDGAGTQNGSSPANAFSITTARNYSINHPNEEIIFLLASGNYGRYWEAIANAGGVGIETTVVNRTAWHAWKADTGQSPVFTSIKIYYSSKRNAYLKFDGIKIEEPNPGLNPNDPPWPTTFSVRFTNANYIQLKNATIKGWNKFLTGRSILIDLSDNVTIDHCDVSVAESGIYTNSPNTVITYNHIHNLSGGSAVQIAAPNLLLEGNHIHDVYKSNADDFFPPDIGYLDPAVWPESNDPGFQIGEDVVSPAEGTPTRGGKILDYEWLNGKWAIYLEECWPSSEIFRTGYTWKSQTTNVTFTLQSYGGGIHTGSAIAIRSSNTVIRKNIIHDFPGQGIYFYSGHGGFENMVVENNLLYNIDNSSDIRQLKGATVVRNNTFIGAISTESLAMGGYPNIFNRYYYAVGFGYYGSFDGTGLQVYNNIVVQYYALPDPSNPSYNKYKEDYNIWWSNIRTCANTKQGDHSLICVWKQQSTSPYYPRGWPNYFENIEYDTEYGGKTGPNVTWTSQSPPYDYDYSVDGVTPFFVNPGFKFNAFKKTEGYYADAGKTWDFRLAAGSPGINFGATPVATWQEVLGGAVIGPSQPPDSLGYLGPDGFIRDDGPARDTNHHSVGCYEYSSAAPPPPITYGDVNEDSEITAFDAALAAHIAVDLGHVDIKNRAAAEVSGDGQVTAYDAALIAQRAVSLRDKFPVEL